MSVPPPKKLMRCGVAVTMYIGFLETRGRIAEDAASSRVHEYLLAARRLSRFGGMFRPCYDSSRTKKRAQKYCIKPENWPTMRSRSSRKSVAVLNFCGVPC